MSKSHLLAAVLFLFAAVTTRSEENMVVHQWATFTVLQDENGLAIGGINIDDVPVPETLHKIMPGSLLPVGEAGETSEERAVCHAEVNLRLEKAVVNFYPATGGKSVGVSAGSSGWLTQFFPAANVESPGFTRDHIGSIRTRFDSSSLSWSGIALHPSVDQAAATENSTEEETSPRPARIEVGGEEADGLIYRGVSSAYRMQLRVIRDGPALRISEAPLGISQLWLVETRADGSSAQRVLRPFDQEMAFVVKTAAKFAPEEWSPTNLDVFASLIQVALRQAGLFAEEAEAVLETLRQMHLRRIGLRLFYLAPTDKYGDAPRPATISTRDEHGRRAEIKSTSVTVGCIELVTPEQRALLATLAAGGDERSLTGQPPKPETIDEARWQQLLEMYGWLGQFRNALLLDEQRRRPSAILAAFIQRFHLEGYTPKRDWPYDKPTR